VNRPRARPDLIAIAIPLIAGAVATAIELSTRSLWLDEGSTFAIVSQHGSALWRGIKGDGGNQLAYYLLMHFILAWFGHAVWVMRLPSVIANALTGGLVAALAQRLFADRRIAIAAGLLTVISLPLVFWGQNARGYAMLVTLGVASFLALVAILQTPSQRTPSRGAVIAYVLTTLAALYVGYDVALLLPAQLAPLVLFRERARLVTGCLVLVLVLCVPLLVLAGERGSGQLFWVTPLSWGLAREAALTVLSAGMPPDFHDTSTTLAAAIVIGVAVLAAIALAARATLPGQRQGSSMQLPLLLVLSWAVVPTVLALILYAAGEPIELPRVTILVMPALALLLAWLLLRPQMPMVVGLAGLAVLLALRLLELVPSYGVSPEPWKTVAAYVARATPAARPACIAFYAQDGREAFDYYLLQRAPTAATDPAPSLRPVLPDLPWRTVRPYVEVYGTLDGGQRAAIARECPRLWLIGSHEGQAHGTHESRVNLRRYQRLEHELRALYPHTTERDFGWASAIHVRLFHR
jgi:mannosyltransferase